MSSAANSYWHMTRLRKETAERLRCLGRRLDRSSERGPLLFAEPGEQGWSLDSLICYLLDIDERHQEASRRANKARKARRQMDRLQAAIKAAERPLFAVPEGTEQGG